jgi:hypothetical protein
MRSYQLPACTPCNIGSHTIRQLNLFAHKATLGLYFEHFRRPLGHAGAYGATWRTKEDFAAKGAPQELLDLLPRYATLVQGRWQTSETFEYRHDVNLSAGVFGFLARLRWGLYISGFAVDDASQIAGEEDWTIAGDLAAKLSSAGFDKRVR